MKIKSMAAAAFAAMMLVPSFAQAQEKAAPAAQIKWYGFVRNYLAFDTRESLAGTEDFFYYLPKDENNVGGTDLNEQMSMRFAALTSRLGVNVSGYEFNGIKMGAKIEADFYSGLTNVTGTATLRLRQAYLTLDWAKTALKIGQAWHPMAADMPDVFSLNTGSPFGAFSRTPLAQADFKLNDNGLSLTTAALWQMQYTSAGPEKPSANYIKYSMIPEIYLGLNFKAEHGLMRIGANMVNIKPRINDGTKKVKDHLTEFLAFFYAQYVNNGFIAKFKTSYGEGGEHMNLNAGYGVTKVNTDGSWDYSPTRNSSSWVSLAYGKKVQAVLFAGYVKNFGTAKEILDPDMLYFSKNSFSNMNQMMRLTPTVVYNLGKFALGLEWEITSVQYGKWDAGAACYGLATKDLHWVTNNRLQMMAKYTF